MMSSDSISLWRNAEPKLSQISSMLNIYEPAASPLGLQRNCRETAELLKDELFSYLVHDLKFHEFRPAFMRISKVVMPEACRCKRLKPSIRLHFG